MTLNRNQIIAIAIAVLSVLAASSANLTDLFGVGVAKTIISASGLINSVLSSILAVITGQGGQVRDVQAMQGVEKIVVNQQANATLASLAVDPSQLKIESKRGDETAIADTAAGSTPPPNTGG